MLSAISSRQRTLLGSVLLAMLLLRAYVPPGFMPAGGSPFQVEICPAGMHMAMPMPVPTHQGDHPVGGHAQADDCPFGNSPATGPASHVLAFEPPQSILSQPQATLRRWHLGVRVDRAHQPRAPPTPA
jgi:hypothetical protein